ncbi:hypothetical protein EV122DRAFT_181020, partial [Schizophyllum commune]
VKTCVATWRKSLPHVLEAQLTFISEVVEYVSFVNKQTFPHGSAKDQSPKALSDTVPIMGPCFTPPTYSAAIRRSQPPEIKPDIAYLKPVTIVHPFYFPQLSQCPKCGSCDVKWEGTTSTGPRKVHGLEREGFALGIQLRCKHCNSTRVATSTNVQVWLPTTSLLSGTDASTDSMPIFLNRSALTHGLYNFLVEKRLSDTLGGLADTVKQATVTDSERGRHKLLKGGLVTIINEHNKILHWVSLPLFTNMLTDVRLRCEALGLEFSEDVQIVYTATFENGTRNPHGREVTRELGDAIYLRCADTANGTPAQVAALEATYARWSRKGGIWTAASRQVHDGQLKHVKDGCLACTRNDLRADGSHIESSHKGWNSLITPTPTMCSFSSGIEMMTHLAFDHTHRRNVGAGLKWPSPSSFLASTFGSH